MKLKITFFIVLAALLGLTISMCGSGSDSQKTADASVTSSPDNTGIKWYGYDDGMALGKKEGKKILINFYADWCTYCKKMDRETFSNKNVADYMNENFIPIKLNSDVEKQLSKEFRVNGLPTTFFMDQNGEKLLALPGYLDRTQFLACLEYVQSDSYRDMSFQQFMSKK